MTRVQWHSCVRNGKWVVLSSSEAFPNSIEGRNCRKKGIRLPLCVICSNVFFKRIFTSSDVCFYLIRFLTMKFMTVISLTNRFVFTINEHEDRWIMQNSKEWRTCLKKLLELRLQFLFLPDKYEVLYIARMWTEAKYFAQMNTTRLWKKKTISLSISSISLLLVCYYYSNLVYNVEKGWVIIWELITCKNNM